MCGGAEVMAPVEDRIGEDLLPAVSGRGWRIEGTEKAGKPIWLPEDFAAGDFLVSGFECGAGTSERVAAGLVDAGVRAIIAQSFDPAFFSQTLEAGLPAAAIEEAPAILSGDRLRVDVETFRVVNLSSGDRYIVRNLSEEMLAQLRRTARR
jgi:3-isopropylmalate dehydratase small subunit